MTRWSTRMYPDLVRVVDDALKAERRPPTGLLHASSHSWKPLRFTQLESVLGTTEEEDYGSLSTMFTGTLWHHWIENLLDNNSSTLFEGEWQLVDTEWDITDWLPKGWTGTLDYL